MQVVQGHNHDEQDVVHSKLIQVFRFLQALHQLRNPVQREINDQPWCLWLHDLPQHPAIQQGVVSDISQDSLEDEPGERSGGGKAEASGDDDFLLKVSKPRLTDPPEPPREITPWLRPGWQSVDNSVEVLPAIDEPTGQTDASGQRLTIRLDSEPRRPAMLAHWMAQRNAWAEAERPARRAMSLYERLRALHAQIERESERLELMIGDGLLTWQHQSGQYLHHPVLLLRVQLHFNPTIPEFTLAEAEQPPELYTALFRVLPDVQPSAIAQARQDVQRGNWHPLGGKETDGFLRRLVNHLSPQGIFAGEGATRESRQAPKITRDPVLFLRTRTLGFSTALEAILEDLPQRKMLPNSLTSIVGIAGEGTRQQAAPPPSLLDSPNGEDEEVLLSKPANAEQAEIARRLERYGAVLVQGPPGTGKTHTIANLLGHLLAQGKSVLVTSHTAKALRVLRDQVVEPLQPLCVSVLDESSKQMESAVDAITERLASSNAEALERQAKKSQEERLALLRQLRKLREQLRDARYDEYRTLVVAGREYSPAQAAKLVAAQRERDDWIPSPITAGVPLPLAEGELIALYRSNTLVTSRDEHELTLALPDPRELMPPSDFEGLVAEREPLHATDLDYRRDLWSGRTTQQTPAILEALYMQLQQAIQPLKEGARWQIAALVAGRDGGPYRQAWDDLIAYIERTALLVAQSQPMLLNYDLLLPEECLPDKIESLIDAIWGYLKAGNKLGTLRLMMHPDWKTVIESASVNGRQPALPEHFEALRTLVRLRRARAELRSRWQRQMVPLDGPDTSQLGAEPERICFQFIPFIRQRLDWYPTTWAPLEQALMQQGFNMAAFLAETPVNLAEHGDLLRLRDAVLQRLPAVLAAENNRRLAASQESQFIALRRRLEVSGSKAAKADVVQGLQAAVESYNPSRYRAAFQSLSDLHVRREVLQRRQTLLAELEQVAPSWAAAIRDRIGRHGERDLPGKPEDAWLWRQLSDELDRRAKTSLTELQQQIAQLSAQLRHTTAQLVEQQAWAAQVRRTTLEQRQALMGWKQTMQRIGKGTGKRAPRLRAEARKLMPTCQSAVPVWIMPLSRVVENFDPRRNRFDVIIIDEASQADLMALTAVYLGRQVVVVGDHEQVSPLAVGQRVEDAQRLIAEHLQGIPNDHLYDGQASIYDVAQRSFDPVCLREHFRCVAPIIEFSNRLAYEGKIKPLRDASRVRLRPHTVAYRVLGASSNEKVNEQEALEVASLLVASTEQPEYASASFGVISLVGDDQAKRIESLLYRHLSESDYQRRRIQCGNAAQFQGDERDVMFLSMVQVPSGGPLPLIDRDQKLYRQRFNVAASRARDQMWLVYSLDPEVDLKPGDLRRRLIEHAKDPEAIKRTQEVQEQQTESELEQRVLRRLVQEGYRVKTQWPVGAYRLDLVVEGNNKRLAIECDGDRYHTGENLAEDMGRQAILERLGWRFARIRGSQFFRHPEQTMEAIFARLRELDIPPEGAQAAESAVETAEELKQRIIRRAAELRREWAEQGEESLSYSGTLAASFRGRRGQLSRLAEVLVLMMLPPCLLSPLPVCLAGNHNG
jgi:very-short-patch-repair endonuclease/Cdc6-like AAA superfamily ATPase